MHIQMLNIQMHLHLLTSLVVIEETLSGIQLQMEKQFSSVNIWNMI